MSRTFSAGIPVPVSSTKNSTRPSRRSNPKRISPSVVNLEALFIRFEMTCASRFWSQTISTFSIRSSKTSFTPGFVRPLCISYSDRHKSLRFIGLKWNSSVPASIFEMSRMSPISCRSRLELVSMMSMNCCFSSSVSASPISLAKPTMALSGVRISWLILARNAVLSRSDSSARIRASMTLSSAFFCSVMSHDTPIISGRRFSTGTSDFEVLTMRVSPFAETYSSMNSMRSPVRSSSRSSRRKCSASFGLGNTS